MKNLIDSDETNETVVLDITDLSHQEINLDTPIVSSLGETPNAPLMLKGDESEYHDGMNNEVSDTTERDQMVGAGITACVFTLMFSPIVAIAVGVGVAHGTKSSGATGDICRTIGDIGLSIREKAIHLNKKHNLVEKTKEGAKNVTKKAKEAEEEHQLLERFKLVLADTWDNLIYFERKNNLLQRTKEKVGQALSFIGEKMRKETRQRA